MEIQRRRHVRIDGSEDEYIFVSTCSFRSPEQVDVLAHDLLRAAGEWRTEIATRAPPGAPAFKTFDFISWTGGRQKIASWLEHPWALARYGKGTSPVFLVKEASRGLHAWIVSLKLLERGEHQWKCRFERSSTVETRDLITTFPYTLPNSPTLGDLEFARRKAA
jgi:hypothetical protein